MYASRPSEYGVSRIVALLGNPSWDSRLRAILRHRAEVIVCRRVNELADVLRTQVDILIVAPWDSSGALVAPAIAFVRWRRPSLPIVVYCALDESSVRQVVALTRSGADEIILRGIDDDSSALWSRLLVSVSRRMAAQTLSELRPLLGKDTEPILSYCLERADQSVTVEELAATLNVHRKTLVNRLAAAGLPGPNNLISWCRLMLAARFLEDPGRSVEQVALTLGFGSGPALRNMIRRYTGLRTSELRKLGGWSYLVRLFAATIGSPQHGSP